jgi:hypothetical protein
MARHMKALLLTFGATAMMATAAIADTGINSLPYTISSPGVYTVKKDLSVQGKIGALIEIGSNDVVVDLGGHTVSGSGWMLGICVQALNHQNIVVRNGTLRNTGKFGPGIQLFGVSEAIIENVTIIAQGDAFVEVNGTTNLVRNCVLVSSASGGTSGISGTSIDLQDCHGDLIKDNLISAIPGPGFAVNSSKSSHDPTGGNVFLNNVISIPIKGPPDGILTSGRDIASGNLFPGWPTTTQLIQ